jgi:hypothetical protein
VEKDSLNLLLLKQISKSEVDVTNIMGELQFDEQEIVLESDMGNVPVSLKKSRYA